MQSSQTEDTGSNY